MLHVGHNIWWRHQMETFSALLAICAGNSPVPGEFPAQRPMTRSFDVFFDIRLNKRSWGWWFETLSCPLWRHCNDGELDVFPPCNLLITLLRHNIKGKVSSTLNKYYGKQHMLAYVLHGMRCHVSSNASFRISMQCVIIDGKKSWKSYLEICSSGFPNMDFMEIFIWNMHFIMIAMRFFSFFIIIQFCHSW